MTWTTGLLIALVIALIIMSNKLATQLRILERKSDHQHDLLMALAKRQGIDLVNPI